MWETRACLQIHVPKQSRLVTFHVYCKWLTSSPGVYCVGSRMGLFLYDWIIFSFFFFGFFLLLSPSKVLVHATCQYSGDNKEWQERLVCDCSTLETLLLNQETHELLGVQSRLVFMCSFLLLMHDNMHCHVFYFCKILWLLQMSSVLLLSSQYFHKLKWQSKTKDLFSKTREVRNEWICVAGFRSLLLVRQRHHI